jgi:hypothetical protein
MAMIEVLHVYRGDLTGDLPIAPGVYDDRDDALFSLAAYLVENGHAVAVDEEQAKAEATLNEWTKAELEDILATMGIDVPARATKAELVALIEQAWNDVPEGA